MMSRSQLRQDPATREWVLIAPHRLSRPGGDHRSLDRHSSAEETAICPFCPGNEINTPPEVYRKNADGAWQVRVVPNRFPALEPDGETQRQDGFFRSAAGRGHHEVIIETPNHNQDLRFLPMSDAAAVIEAYQARYRELSNDPTVRFITIFRNHGRGAGTSLAHPHSQLLATPVVPTYMRWKHEIAERYLDDTNRNLYSDIRDNELKSGARIVEDTARFTTFVPFAASVPFEMWIMPRADQSSLTMLSDCDRVSFAEALQRALLRLATVCGDVDYNYIIHSCPLKDEEERYYVWHVQIIPRLTQPAGLELGSRMYINPVLPEAAAEQLRRALASSGRNAISSDTVGHALSC